MKNLIKKRLPQLNDDDNLFPSETFNVVYRRNKTLNELLTPSLFPISRNRKIQLCY